MNVTLAPAFGTQKGPWEWRSFTDGDHKEKTVIMVRASRGFQYLLTLDWFDYDGMADIGRQDAETMAKFICAAVNQYTGNTPPTCDDCQQRYAVWFAPNPIWNFVMGGPNAKEDPGGMLCPRCFTLRAEAVGVVPTAWEVRPEQPYTMPANINPT